MLLRQWHVKKWRGKNGSKHSFHSVSLKESVLCAISGHHFGHYSSSQVVRPEKRVQYRFFFHFFALHSCLLACSLVLHNNFFHVAFHVESQQWNKYLTSNSFHNNFSFSLFLCVNVIVCSSFCIKTIMNHGHDWFLLSSALDTFKIGQVK